jgi:hypothetical protein
MPPSLMRGHLALSLPLEAANDESEDSTQWHHIPLEIDVRLSDVGMV